LIGPTDLLHLSPVPYFKTLPGISDLLSEVPKFQHRIKVRAKCGTSLVSFKSNLLITRALLLLNAAFAMEILDLISRVRLASFLIMLPKWLKVYIFFGCFLSIIICIGTIALMF
jgi:hypothetical protein